MGLAASQFENTNPNFATVTFIVTDGGLTVERVDAVIMAVPQTSGPIYNGSKQELIIAGEVDGGILYYALSTDPENAPDDESYDTVVPSAKETGSYYIWYKVESDSNHNDLAPVCIKVVLAEKDWVKLDGVLYQNDGITPLAGAQVTLISGNQTVDFIATDGSGEYWFIVPTGVYNIVAAHEQITETTMVTLLKDTKQDTVMPDGRTESLLKVDAADGDFGVAVGGLDREAYHIRTSENVPADTYVSVTMTVKPKTEETAANADPILELAKNKSLEFFDIKVEKTVGSVKTSMKKTESVLEIAVPYSKTAKRGLAVYACGGTNVQTFTESSSKKEGTFRVDKENGIIYIYSNRASTFALGYTPYYRVDSSVSLGSFEGTATVTISSLYDETEVYTLENVEIGNICFDDIPKGQYIMTITWEDGVSNTLTVPLTIGAKSSASAASTVSRPSVASTAAAGAVKGLSAASNGVFVEAYPKTVSRAAGVYGSLSGMAARGLAAGVLVPAQKPRASIY